MVKGWATPSSSASAYGQARVKLDESTLADIVDETGAQLERMGHSARWKQQRVIVVDVTGVSMPDTPAHQAAQWPQPSSQKPGCGFPLARVCACFCLATGAVLSRRIGHRKQQELRCYEADNILLGNIGFMQLLRCLVTRATGPGHEEKRA